MEALQTTALAVDAALFSLIWIVQTVVYPSFVHIEASSFKSWHKGYTQRMGYIVAPLMIAQLGLSLSLLASQSSFQNGLHACGAAATWLVTFLVSVPLHRHLERQGKQQNTIRKLVLSNWIRTTLWTLLFAQSLVRDYQA